MLIGIEALQAFALLVAANATPVVVAKLARWRWAWPLDFGYVLRDGERLFGAHKTWRGLVAGTLASTLAAWSMGLPPWVGAGFGVAALIADVLSSAVKRRLKLRPGTETVGLDQLGEALLPLLLFSRFLSLDAAEVVTVTVVFAALDIALAQLRH
ncbi:CDP-archaeol synthase [Peristeroidobacter soli]|jgi:CDP-2,3-bis-(O-geranylgeranyl)-sn-glycerol synthase|uniref:CDP-archaeol synthase n=1 Tax=Peristeroidobacter soli TaxID=2497877 RepID=UPI00101D6D5E|nr:CDP-archaeol synthase [Peristeroidobacter soli]